MIRGIRETHYDVLSSREDASHDEIRASYRSAVLVCHPDKLPNDSSASLEQRFLKVQKAWEVLGDSGARSRYDHELRVSRRDCDVAVSEDVGLEEMAVEEDEGGDVVELYRQCRCGDYFSVDSVELGKMGCDFLRNEDMISLRMGCGVGGFVPGSVVLPCSSCSLKIRLLIDPSVCVSLVVGDHT